MVDLSGSYALLPNPVTVGFVQKTGRSTYAPEVEVPSSQVRWMEQTSTEGGALLKLRRLVANLWRSRLVAAGFQGEPKTNDVLVVNGVRHTITQVDHCARRSPVDPDPTGGLPQRFRCHLTRENA